MNKTTGQILWEVLDSDKSNKGIVTGAWTEMPWNDLPEEVQEGLEKRAKEFLSLIKQPDGISNDDLTYIFKNVAIVVSHDKFHVIELHDMPKEEP